MDPGITELDCVELELVPVAELEVIEADVIKLESVEVGVAVLDPCTPSISIGCPNDVIELEGNEFELGLIIAPTELDINVLDGMELDRVELDIAELDMVEFDDIVELDDAELDDIELDGFETCLGTLLPCL